MKINGVELTDFELFVLCRWTYSIGVSIITNEEYTRLLASMHVQYPDNEYVNRSWSSDPCPTELCNKVGKPEWIQAVVLGDKTESIPSLNSWEAVTSQLHSITDGGTLSMKLDGWNIQSNYYNGVLLNIQSRGRTRTANDLSVLKNKIPNRIPVQGKVRVKMEGIVTLDDFPKCKQVFNSANPRNAVHSALGTNGDPNLITLVAHGIDGIHVDADKIFSTLAQWGFLIPAYHKVDTFEELKAAMSSLDKMYADYNYPTDGLVYNGREQWAIRLLSWEEPIYISYVVDYDEKFSSNRINPRLKVYPIDRNGTNQEYVNITNWERIIKNNLRIGYPVAFEVKAHAVADFHEEATKSLQKEWYGREDVFRETIEANERAKRAQFHPA